MQVSEPSEFTLYVSLSESSLKLPPSESESFTISLILSVLINIFFEGFSEIKFGPGFSILLVALQTSTYDSQTSLIL